MEDLLDIFRIDGFLRGFIAGQLVSVICVLFFIRYFLLASPSSYICVRPVKRRKEIQQTKEIPKIDSSIDKMLLRLGIEHQSEVNESCGWLNLLLARLIFAQLHEDSTILEKCVDILEHTISDATIYVRDFTVKELLVTPEEVPRIDGFRLKKFYGSPLTLDGSPSTYCLEGRIRWHDALRFEVEAAAALNWPSNSPIVLLPCSISVKVINLEAMIRISLPDDLSTCVELSLVPEQYNLELEIESSIGHRTRLRNIEKISQLIATLVRKALEDNLVWPNRIPILFPKLSDLIISEPKTI